MPHSLIRHLEQFGPLSEAEKHALEGAATRVRVIGADQDLVSDGDQPTDCKLILSGFACTYKLLPDGRRQIMSFQIPGDICDLQGFFLARWTMPSERSPQAGSPLSPTRSCSISRKPTRALHARCRKAC